MPGDAVTVPPHHRDGGSGGGHGRSQGLSHHPRRTPARRPVCERVEDWQEVYTGQGLLPIISAQAGRCMDCGIPFCHDACPLGNMIPDWNDLVYREDWAAAAERLHATNNFPEFTGRLCPAPCESACVLTINADPVTIKNVEVAIADRAWEDGLASPVPRAALGLTVAVVGSGPAGLAAAQQLTRVGHTVTVYERADRLGGLLRYGIPEFKMEKHHLDRRLAQMRAEGTLFRTEVEVGADLDAERVVAEHDAVLLAVGATAWRELPVPGRELAGIHQAMEYLPLANRVQEGDLTESPVSAEGKDVVIVGGGDTGADCLGTVLRQHAASVVQLDINPLPGEYRHEQEPWPVYPHVYRVSPPTRRPVNWPGAASGTRRSTAVCRCPARRATSGCSPPRPSASRATTRGTSGRSTWSGWSRGTAARSTAPSASSPPSWCCWRWGSRGPNATAGW